MKNFRFSLEGVLTYKNQLLTGLQEDAARAVKALDKLIAEEQAKEKEYQNRKLTCNGEQQSGTNPQMMQFYHLYLKQLSDEKVELARKHKVLLREKNAAIEKLTAMKVEVKALEKLREKELREYRMAAAKEEERVVEEFVVFERMIAAR